MVLPAQRRRGHRADVPQLALQRHPRRRRGHCQGRPVRRRHHRREAAASELCSTDEFSSNPNFIEPDNHQCRICPGWDVGFDLIGSLPTINNLLFLIWLLSYLSKSQVPKSKLYNRIKKDSWDSPWDAAETGIATISELMTFRRRKYFAPFSIPQASLAAFPQGWARLYIGHW